MMNQLQKIASVGLLTISTFMAGAMESVEELTQGMDNLQVAETSNRPITPHINLAIKTYVNNHPEKRKLLMPCGHQPIEDNYYDTDIFNSYHVHEHKGWYTVDGNPALKPDYIGDLSAAESLDYIFQPNIWDIIYLTRVTLKEPSQGY